MNPPSASTANASNAEPECSSRDPPAIRHPQPPLSPPAGAFKPASDVHWPLSQTPSPWQSLELMQLRRHAPSLQTYGAQSVSVPPTGVALVLSALHTPEETGATHWPAVHTKPTLQSLAAVQLVLHLSLAQAYGSQAVSAITQAPVVPLHLPACAMFAAQVGVPQSVPSGMSSLHAVRFVPSQAPAQPVSPVHLLRLPAGAPVFATHVPVESHFSHWPSQAVSQHTPSTQCLVGHSSSFMQLEPDVRGIHVLLEVWQKSMGMQLALLLQSVGQLVLVPSHTN